MLLSIYTLLATVTLLALFVTVVTIDTRGVWSDVWLFTAPLGLLCSLLLAAASTNIEVVSGGSTSQFVNEYLVILWLGLASFSILYIVYGPIAYLREALAAGPSEHPLDVGRETAPDEAGQRSGGRIMRAYRESKRRGELDLDFNRERPRRPARDDTDQR